MTKEQIYDEKIAPLMTEIIETCKSNSIAFFAHFCLDEIEEAEQMLCTTALPVGSEKDNRRLRSLTEVAKPQPITAAFTVTKLSQRE